MEIYRLFICVNLSDILKEQISEYLYSARRNYRTIKWVRPENLHITLKFLGDTPVNKVDKIKEILSYVAESNSEFTLELSGTGVFPGLNRPRVVWLGISGGVKNLKEIRNSLGEEMEKIGFPMENRDFKGHITLGRVKRFEKKFKGILQDIQLDKLYRQQVKSIDLMKSTLLPGGPVYDIMGQYFLKETY